MGSLFLVLTIIEDPRSVFISLSTLVRIPSETINRETSEAMPIEIPSTVRLALSFLLAISLRA
jgi:hypothetical protein